MNVNYEDEMYFSARRRATIATRVSFISLGIAVMAVAGMIGMLPLKRDVPYIFMTDRTTGEVERLYKVPPLGISSEDAVRQAALARYVIDRETYDPYDNHVRVESVVRASRGDAENTWRALWSEDNPEHPDKSNLGGSKLRTTIIEINEPVDGIAQVRFKKTQYVGGREKREAYFVATIKFGFNSKEMVSTVEEVWNNPLRFYVEEYRVDAITRSAER